MISFTEIDLYFPHLPQGLEELRVLHVGDLHTRGFGAKEEQLEKLLRERADMIICSGDFLTFRSASRDFFVRFRTSLLPGS